MSENIGYVGYQNTFKLNVDNIHTIDDVKNVLNLIGIMFSFYDGDPRTDSIKKYFDIPYEWPNYEK
jgi:hypothetical protein